MKLSKTKISTSNEKKFLFNLFFLSIFFLIFIFIINILIDPLWYFKGNQIQKTNLVFNERFTKMNLFLRNKTNSKYNCYIFGTSVSTTINQNSFKKNKCFNFSFSAGNINEYLKYLDYLKNKNFYPEIVYIELPTFFDVSKKKKYEELRRNFKNTFFVGYFPPTATDKLHKQFLVSVKKTNNINDESNVPDFIIEDRKPKSYLIKYLSLNSFTFSIKSFFNLNNYTNAYDKNFISFVRKDVINFINKKFDNKNFKKDELKRIIMNRIEAINYFDSVYDFSVPGYEINDFKNTYDGSHYYADFISQVAYSMEYNIDKFGLEVNTFNYENNYLSKFEIYLKN